MHCTLARAAAALAFGAALYAAPLASPVVAQAMLNSVADFALPTTAGVTRSIVQYRGRVVLLFFEDRGTVRQNEHLRRALTQVQRTEPPLAGLFALVPVANVSGYNYWPMRHFAEQTVRSYARNTGIELWLDWSHTLQSRLRLREGVSNVVVIDRHGRVRYHRWGRVPDTEVTPFMNLLRALAREN